MSSNVYRCALIFETKWRINTIKLSFFSPCLFLPLSSLSKKSTTWIIETRGFFFPLNNSGNCLNFPFHFSLHLLCRLWPHVHNETMLLLHNQQAIFTPCLNFSIDYVALNCINHTLIWFLKKKKKKTGLAKLALSPPSPLISSCLSRVTKNFKAMSSILSNQYILLSYEWGWPVLL